MPAPASRALGEIAGPLLLAYSFNWGLLGILTIQVCLYHVTFSTQDSILLQCLVYGVLIFEWVQTGLLTECGFVVFVNNYGSVGELYNTCNGWFFLVVMCAIVSMIVQWFFAWRIYMLCRARILVAGILLLSLVQGGCGIASGVLLRSLSSTVYLFATAPTSTRVIAGIWYVGSGLVDLTIAITMTILMLRRKTGIRETDMIINRIIRLVVETGTLTAGVSAFIPLLLIVSPNTTFYEPPLFCLAKLYSNTFITNLLNRAYLNDAFRQRDSRIFNQFKLSLTQSSRELAFRHSGDHASEGDSTDKPVDHQI